MNSTTSTYKPRFKFNPEKIKLLNSMFKQNSIENLKEILQNKEEEIKNLNEKIKQLYGKLSREEEKSYFLLKNIKNLQNQNIKNPILLEYYKKFQ